MEKLKPCQLCWGEGKAKAAKKDHTGFSLWSECVKCYVRSGGCCSDLKNIKVEQSVDLSEKLNNYLKYQEGKR